MLHDGSIHGKHTQAGLSPGRHGVRNIPPPSAHQSGALPVALLHAVEHVPHQVATLEEGGHGVGAGGTEALHSDLEEGHKIGALLLVEQPNKDKAIPLLQGSRNSMCKNLQFNVHIST